MLFRSRIVLGNTSTLRRYVAIAVTTAGGFTAATLAVALTKNLIAGTAF